METGLFPRSGKNNPSVKWQKNIFRFVTVFATALISWGGADDLDKVKEKRSLFLTANVNPLG